MAFRVLPLIPLLIFFTLTATASDTILRRAPDSAPAISGPTFTLTLTGVDSYLGVAATPGSGVAGSASGDLFLRTNQKVLISTNGGTSAALTIDPAANLSTPGSMTAASFVGNVNSAANFSGPLAGDVTGSQSSTQVAFVGGQSATNIASGVQAANAATSTNTAETIAKRDRSGEIAVGSIRFADGSVLSSASARKYYLTSVPVTGSQATTQCASGFHMASVWELVNLSTLSYDTTRGLVKSDSGSGPPLGGGWVRTGGAPHGDNLEGLGNCMAWTSDSLGDYGTEISLSIGWTYNPQTATQASTIVPWKANTATCASQLFVWCIQD